MPATTWSTTDKDASIVLSNANLTATTGGVSGAAIRSKDPKRTGKYYIEATLNWTAVGQFADRFGVALGGSSIGDFSAGTGGTISFRTDGTCSVFGGSGTFVTPSIAAGNIVGIAINLDAQLIWFRLTSGPSNNWNTSSTSTADPVAGVGGLSFSGGPYALGRGVADAYIYASVDSGAGQAITLNAGGSAFNGAVPSGYTSGWDDSVSPILNLVGSQYVVEAYGSLGSTVALQASQLAVEAWGAPNTFLAEAGLIRESLYAYDATLRASGLVREVLRSTGTGAGTFLGVDGTVREVLRSTASLSSGASAFVIIMA